MNYFLMKVFYLYKAFILTILFLTDQSHQQEDQIAIEKKTKVLACFALSRNRLEKDKTFRSTLDESKGQEEFQKNLMHALVNCYSKISFDQISTVMIIVITSL